MAAKYRVGVDVGGTFTDIALEGPNGLTTAKCLTTPRAPEEGVVDGIAIALEDAGLRAGDVDLLVHGTTLATNAIIERKGAVSALVTTAGFRDILETGYESRYDQYDLYLDKRPPLIPRRRRFGVPERISAAGKVLRDLDEDAVRALVPALERQQVRSVAVGFLHGYANPTHEQRVREILTESLPDLDVTLSSEVCPEIREYDRLSTACANAYVQPLMTRYLRRLEAVLRERGLDCPIFLMSSGGGLMTLETGARFPIRLVESGPAGGAVLAGRIAAECAHERVVAFDMGGTTAKICMIDGFVPDTVQGFEVDRAARLLRGSGLPLRIPAIEMIEIGAGGGSVARVDEIGRIAVGPRSAGADPGPACYGRGGVEATVTDADLVLGRIDAGRFAGGTMALRAGGGEPRAGACRRRPARSHGTDRGLRHQRGGGRANGQCRPGARDRARPQHRRSHPDCIRRRRPVACGTAGGEARDRPRRGADPRRRRIGDRISAGTGGLRGRAESLHATEAIRLRRCEPGARRPRRGGPGCGVRRSTKGSRCASGAAPTCATPARGTRSSCRCRDTG